MSEQNVIPDDAVEAACNHFWYDRDNGAVFEDEVSGALNAALPLMLAALAESRQDTATGELFRFTLEQRQWLRGWGK